MILLPLLRISAFASPSLVSDLTALAQLFTEGLLTPSEFRLAKQKLLNDSPAAPQPQRFFGVAKPDFDIPAGREIELLAYNVTGSAGAVLTQFQLYGAGDQDAACFKTSWCLSETGFNDTRIRYYIDGESTASIDYLLYLAHGIGATGAPRHQPWGVRRWGSGIGDKPAVYNTLRVPFTRSIRITAQLPPRIKHTQRYWVDLWGCEAIPIAIGGGSMMLQPTEWRLRLTKNEGIRPALQDYITVAESHGAQAGLLYFLTVSTLAHNCSDDECAYGFFEGCWLWGNSTSTPQTAQLLTSGGEEMFFG